MKKIHLRAVTVLFIIAIGLCLKYICWTADCQVTENKTVKVLNKTVKALYMDFCDEKLEEGDSKPIFVLGILSKPDNRPLRDLHRKYLRETLGSSFRFVMCFLLDLPTADVLLESKEKRDIVILNSSQTGYARGFGEKLHRLYGFAFNKFPSALLVGRMDDDAFVCAPDIFDVLKNVSSPLLYFGWQHHYDTKKIESGFRSGRSDMYSQGVVHSRHDEMFVVIGRELLHRIMKRRFCSDKKQTCKASVDLIDTNYGGTSLGTWLSIYSDVKQISENRRIVHGPKILQNYLNPSFCETYLLLHPVKSTKDIEDMYRFRKQ